MSQSEFSNFQSNDLFADTGGDDSQTSKDAVHIRIQQRNGRKTLTTVQGINPKFDRNKLLKTWKKTFACNGTVVVDEDLGEVVQLQGDQRLKVQAFLIDEKISKKEMIKIHGF